MAENHTSKMIQVSIKKKKKHGYFDIKNKKYRTTIESYDQFIFKFLIRYTINYKKIIISIGSVSINNFVYIYKKF